MATATPVRRKNKTKKEELDLELGPMDPARDNAARERLIQARVTLLMKSPFFGNLATRLKLVNADERMETAATDGRNLYYNSKFIMALAPEEVVFLIGHEILHLVYDHMGRRGDRRPRLYNVAADFCVNADLVKHRVGRMITTVGCLYDEKYEGWTSEQVYDDLIKDMPANLDELCDMLLDEHMDNDNLTDEERNKLRNEIREAVLSAAKSAKSPGDLPASIRQMLEDMTEPKMNWRDLLNATIPSAFRSDYTWLKPSRRAWHMDAVLPGSDFEKQIDIVCAMDASGSCVDMLRDWLGEVKGIMEQFQNYRIHLLTFDTDVYNPQIFTPENINDLLDYKIMGGGGTLFEPVYRYLMDNDIVPEKLVWLTDLCAADSSWHAHADYCDTIWIVHSTKMTPPFGTHAFYEGA